MPHPTAYLGDFNSHNSNWGYCTNDADGELLINLAAQNNLEITYDAKNRGTFHSARWNCTYTPDLCFLTCSSTCMPTTYTQSILNRFPKYQHSPIITELGISIPYTHSPPIARWNLQNTNWPLYREIVNKTVKLSPRQLKAQSPEDTGNNAFPAGPKSVKLSSSHTRVQEITYHISHITYHICDM